MPVQDEIVIPSSESVAVALEPAHNAFSSLLLLGKAEHLSGLGEWVVRTVDALTPEERERHRLVMIGLHYAVAPTRSWPTFPAYVDHLAALPPVALRDRLLDAYAKIACCEDEEARPVDIDSALESAESYLTFLHERFPSFIIDEELETIAYTYVLDPPEMQELIVSHLRGMWERYLAVEWERAKSTLQDAVDAFRQVDLSGLGQIEAAKLITGQDIDEEKWAAGFSAFDRVIFVPSIHVGPYMNKFGGEDTLWVVFGARLPEGSQYHAPDLSRTDILTRLSALSDDTRLRILKLVSEEGEKSSQDIMARLDLSQSSASRHLKQLSATGYLFERRCKGAKCYSLNPDRIEATLGAISLFLLGR
jgi:DNA-binding transcriptional ArsR family regulator